MLRRILALLLASAPLAGVAQTPSGRTFYVDASKGDDAASGTATQPWKTLHRSLTGLGPGDTLLLRGSFFERDVSIAVRGTKERPITIRNQPGQSAIIDGAIAEFRATGNNDW